MDPEVLISGVLFAALVVYVLTGGADFGGGVWDLLASGPRRADQRRLIARAIGPIWEANHVWLILVIVVLFVSFPRGFALVSTALHVPLTAMLFGIVIRGSAFVFRAYDTRADVVQTRWSWAFSLSSTATVMILGICVGTLATGTIPVVDGRYAGTFTEWLAPFPFAIGAFTCVLCAQLAAVYLTNVTDDVGLQEAFRRRALGATGAVFATAWFAFLLARSGAPRIAEGLVGSPQAWSMQVIVAAIGAGLIHALWRRRYGWARAAVILQVILLIAGWGAAQYPWIVVDAMTVQQAATLPSVLWSLLGVLALGAPGLAAAYLWMLVVFRSRPLDGAPGAPP